MRNTFVALLAACMFLVANSHALATDTDKATDFYLRYRAAWDNAKSMDEMFPYLVKQVRTEYEAAPKPQRQPMFDAMHTAGALTGVKVVKESRRGDVYVLDLTAIDRDKKRAKGVAEIVTEDGAMKVKSEHWSS